MFQETLYNIVCKINEYLSNYILIAMLVGVGLWYSIRTRFVQVRCFGEGMKKTFGNLKLRGGRQDTGMSSFQALATAIAAQVGTGNIVGASGAILAGGPGAIFWMWVIAFFGMATIYAEATLAQETRVVNEDGSIAGGPVYYIKRAFKGGFGKFMTVFFAVFAIIALGVIGPMVQSNSIGSTFETAFGIPAWIVGIIVAVLAGLVFFGGLKVLASVTEKLVPIMACLYLVGGLVVLAARITYIPAAFGMIFKYAFTPNAIIGGAIGTAIKMAISQGAKRGLFSNEAGMGSTPHAHALAQVEKPHDQGVVAMIGVFIDTFVVLTMTALVVISTLYTKGGVLEAGAAAGVDKTNMAQLAFGSVFGEGFGSAFVAICLLFFAFSTILGWNLFAKINAEYLFGKVGGYVLAVIAVVTTFLGTIWSNDFVWELQDMSDMLIVLPNVIALFALSALVVKSVKDGYAAKKAAKEKEADK